MVHFTSSVLSVALCIFTSSLVAQVGPPVVNPANGHTYYLSTNRLLIGPAQALAASIGGYLVAINDAAEDAWISANFANVPATYLWLGLHRPGSGLPFTQWDSGEPLVYTNWCPGEPNGPFTEPYVMRNWCNTTSWNDASGGSADVWHALIEVGGASYFTFGGGCPGSQGVTSLNATALPRIGQTMTVDLVNLPAQVAVMMVGLSNTNSAFGPLPLDLTTFGMPGCLGRVSPDVTVLVTGSPATFSFAMPGSPTLVGLRFYQQALVLDPLVANPARLVVSDAAAATVGI